MHGILLKAHGGFYFVQAEGRVFACTPRGRLKQELKTQPLGLIIGDRLEISPLNGEVTSMDTAYNGLPEAMPKAVIENLLPRHNYLIRPKIANVHQCLIVLAAKHPKPDFLLLDRLLIFLSAADITPVIVLNKIDQPGAEQLLQDLNPYRQAGFTVLPVSAVQNQGIELLLRLLPGKTTAVAGQSGVGKSTLLNLLQQGRKLLIGEISRKLQRGRHTTRTVELLPLMFDDAEGWIADTPGFSRLGLPDGLTAADLTTFYPDFFAFASDCHYAGCRHQNEPLCGVKQAVEAGRLDSARYQRYLTLLNEIIQNKMY